ncbi:MAG: ABC transporter ATP-binding protein [Nannocystaceae bacterium]|nr:ABC transporter ATP-binding protein [Nannocystaceae bacterium]
MTLHGHALGATIGERALFSGLDLELPPGSMTAIVGPNGSGKSTLIRGLCGLGSLEGSVTHGGTPLAGLEPRTRARAIAYLPQQASAAPGMTVQDVVMLGRLPHRTRLAGPSSADRAHVVQSLETVGMKAFMERPIQTLSGGERQRVMLARMLATEANTMVLDEPTAALDIGYALELLGTLRSLASQGRAVLLALHDLTLADAYADRIVCLSGRGTAEVGPREEVLDPLKLHGVFGVEFSRQPGGPLRLELRKNR